MSLPNFVTKYAMEKAGGYLGGPVGAAVAALGITTAFAVEGIGILGQKLNAGTAKWSDVVYATATAEAALYAAGVFGGATGLIAAPGALVGAIVIAAGVFAVYHKNPIATLDALETAWNGIGNDQPWTIAAKTIKAYSAEIQRGMLIDQQVNTAYTAALTWSPPQDPLVLDLNGGGITTSGINRATPILFDQDGDGTLTATGWIAVGEAIVVRDLNGNGRIDSGRELFGDNTVLTRGPNVGQLASNGFTALADLDVNAAGVADGKFDAGDVAFASVKLWKDANQNGVSEAAELFSFADLGVQSINLAAMASNVSLGGGNTQIYTGGFTQVGSAGQFKQRILSMRAVA